MDLRLLEYFLAVAREENITNAAKTLHVTQPTLSRQMHELEELVGKQLFTRTNRKTTLTKNGELFRRRAEEIVTLIHKTKEELSSTSQNMQGKIHIGAGETYLMKSIADTLNKIHQAHPLITFRIYSGVADDVLEKVDAGLLDFALVFEPVKKEKYEYIPIAEHDQIGVLMRDDDPFAKKEVITFEDLTHMELLVSSREGINDTPFVTRLKENPKMHIIGSYNLIYNAAILVDSHLGQAVTINQIAPRLPHLLWKPIAPKVETDLVLIWKKYDIMSPACHLFLQEIRKIHSQKK